MGAWIIFTDLDATLLDSQTYSPGPVVPILERLRSRGIPVILCSSKTRAEMALWWERLSLKDPFIVENGSAVVFPPSWRPLPETTLARRDGWLLWELGLPHGRVAEELRCLSEDTGLPVLPLSSMSEEEIVRRTGLSQREARLARMREYSEPFLVQEVDPLRLADFLQEAEARGLTCTRGGRFFHLMGPTDKGKAVRLLSKLLRAHWGEVKAVGLGDSPNDFPMLEAVEVPVLVKRPDGTYAAPPPTLRCYRAPAAGPRGWAEAVERILDKGELPEAWLAPQAIDPLRSMKKADQETASR